MPNSWRSEETLPSIGTDTLLADCRLTGQTMNITHLSEEMSGTDYRLVGQSIELLGLSETS